MHLSVTRDLYALLKVDIYRRMSAESVSLNHLAPCPRRFRLSESVSEIQTQTRHIFLYKPEVLDKFLIIAKVKNLSQSCIG